MFKASPRQVYDMLMDSKKHRSLSGQPAKISRKVGGKFTAWGSHISGFNLALKPGQKIVQAWRATGWWPDHYSVAIYEIAKTRGRTRLKFTQIGIPPNRYSGHYRGWRDLLDADEGDLRDRSDKPTDQRQGKDRS
jgi:uncharacterized protein YndB with AHSA1/START domain